MKIIYVDISDDGEVKIETKGFSGKACIEETKFLKDLLGEETERSLTACYFSTDTQVVRKKHLNLCG